MGHATLVKPAARIEAARLVADLETLSGPRFGGRGIGSPGHDLARDWIAERLIDLGYGVSFVRAEAQSEVIVLRDTPRAWVGDRELRYRTEFVEHPRSAPLDSAVTGPVRDFGDPRISGAWVVLRSSGLALAELTTGLAAGGALGVVMSQASTGNGYLAKRVAGSSVGLPMLSMERKQLAGIDGRALTACIPLDRVRPSVVNVLGQLGPQGALLRLVVGAHYDAMGDDYRGERFPGASDNAAGVAVVLEVARLLAAEIPHAPLLVAAFDGEEIGAVGARAVASSLSWQDPKPVVLNVDGAGRVPDLVAVEAAGPAAPLLAALDKTGRRHRIRLTVGSMPSDNRAFAALGFGSVGIGLGINGLHTPADTADRVDSKAMVLAAKLLFGAAVECLTAS